MLIRANEHARGEDFGSVSCAEAGIRTIALAKVGTSAEECASWAILRREDGVSMNRDRAGGGRKRSGPGVGARRVQAAGGELAGRRRRLRRSKCWASSFSRQRNWRST